MLTQIFKNRFWMIAGLFGLLPLVNFLPVTDPSRSSQGLVLTLLLLLGLIFGLLSQTRKPPRSFPKWMTIAVLIFTAFRLLSVFGALSPGEALYELTLLAGMLVLWFSFLQENKNRLFNAISKMMVFSMALLAIWGIAQLLGFRPGQAGHEIQASMGNQNQFAYALLFGLPFLLWQVFRGNKKWKIIGGVSTLLSLSGIIFSLSRGAVLGLGIMILVGTSVGLVFWMREKGGKGKLWLLLIPILGLLIYRGTYPIMEQKAGSWNFALIVEDEVRNEQGDNSLDFRFKLWNRSLAMAKEHPFLGVGAGNWRLHIQKYGAMGWSVQGGFGLAIPQRPHNEFFKIWCESGWGALLGFLALLVLGFGGAIRQIRPTANPEQRIQGLLCLMALSATLLPLAFSFPLERPFNSLLLWSWLAFAAQGWPKSALTPLFHRREIPGFALALMLACLALQLLRLPPDLQMRKIRSLKAQQDWPGIIAAMADPPHWWYAYSEEDATPFESFLGMAYLQNGQLSQGLATLEEARAKAPYSLIVRSNLAAAYEMNKFYPDAIREYQGLVETFPHFEEAWLNLGVAHFHKGEFALCRDALQKVGPKYQNQIYKNLNTELSKVGR